MSRRGGPMIPFPGTQVPKMGTPEYEAWRGQMAMWAYVNGPVLLDTARRLAEIEEFLKKDAG